MDLITAVGPGPAQGVLVSGSVRYVPPGRKARRSRPMMQTMSRGPESSQPAPSPVVTSTGTAVAVVLLHHRPGVPGPDARQPVFARADEPVLGRPMRGARKRSGAEKRMTCQARGSSLRSASGSHRVPWCCILEVLPEPQADDVAEVGPPRVDLRLKLLLSLLS